MAGASAGETPASRIAKVAIKVAIIDVMAFRFSMVAFLLLATGLDGLLGFVSPPPRQDNEQKLQARIERQRNPVKKAKLKVRLGRVKLLQAIEAYDRGERGQCQQLLDAYLEVMKSAWTDLQGSGRQAWRKPDGFKQLDIGLRENARFLQDLMHRVPFEERGPVEKVFQEAERLRAAVLEALFPSERPRKADKNFIGESGAQILNGAVLG